MRLTLSIDLDVVADDPTAEVGRILRYWAGAVGQMDLNEEADHPLMNSAYTREVGSIRLHQV